MRTIVLAAVGGTLGLFAAGCHHHDHDRDRHGGHGREWRDDRHDRGDRHGDRRCSDYYGGHGHRHDGGYR